MLQSRPVTPGNTAALHSGNSPRQAWEQGFSEYVCASNYRMV